MSTLFGGRNRGLSMFNPGRIIPGVNNILQGGQGSNQGLMSPNGKLLSNPTKPAPNLADFATEASSQLGQLGGDLDTKMEAPAAPIPNIPAQLQPQTQQEPEQPPPAPAFMPEPQLANPEPAVHQPTPEPQVKTPAYEPLDDNYLDDLLYFYLYNSMGGDGAPGDGGAGDGGAGDGGDGGAW
jgi:hypothetical protein